MAIDSVPYLSPNLSIEVRGGRIALVGNSIGG